MLRENSGSESKEFIMCGHRKETIVTKLQRGVFSFHKFLKWKCAFGSLKKYWDVKKMWVNSQSSIKAQFNPSPPIDATLGIFLINFTYVIPTAFGCHYMVILHHVVEIRSFNQSSVIFNFSNIPDSMHKLVIIMWHWPWP